MLVGTTKSVTWRFPSATAPVPTDGFYFPDDANLAKHGTAIITNQEDQDTIIELAFDSHPSTDGLIPGQPTGAGMALIAMLLLGVWVGRGS